MLFIYQLFCDITEILTIRGGDRKAKSADVEKEILDETEKGNYHTRQQLADMIKDKCRACSHKKSIKNHSQHDNRKKN